MEFTSLLDHLQEAILACRPRDIHGFAIRFFIDEKQPNSEEAHAIHMLPFLMFNKQRFKAAASIVFSHHIAADSASRLYLEPSVVLMVVSRLGMNGLNLRSKCIDEV